jgi:hypothetical protein
MSTNQKASATMTTNTEMPASEANDPVRVLLAGPDTLYFSCDLDISAAMRERLTAEKAEAQALGNTMSHCPDWLGARVCPQGARGGYAFLLETADFSVKVLGERIQNRPGIFLEMRSLALHTHPQGPAGACEAALAWVREKLFADQAKAAREAVTFAVAKVSRADIHIDWQGGFAPTITRMVDELHCFIRPGRVKGALYFQGHHATGYQFGRSKVLARLYNKSAETREKANDAYSELLTARNGDRYDPTQNVWRLEFQVQREGIKGFKLYAPPDPEAEDDELAIAAELAAEELQHIGTLPRFFARMDDLFQYLTGHWLRLALPSADANRSRWPLHPTWATLKAEFATIAQVAPLTEDQRQLVRGARFRGKSRILRRLEAGILNSLEVEDASPTSAALLALQRWVEQIAEREMRRITAKCERYAAQNKPIPCWVWRGMDERFQRVEQVEHRVQMLLGVFAAHGVLPLEFKPAQSVGELLAQHLDALEQEVAKRGGVQQVLADHFAKVYKVHLRPVA